MDHHVDLYHYYLLRQEQLREMLGEDWGEDWE